jgi:hypothetical protein
MAQIGKRASVVGTGKLVGVVAAAAALVAGVTSGGAVTAGAASSVKASSAFRPALTAPLHVYRARLTPAQIAAYAKDADKSVIVLLRDQFSSTLAAGDASLGVRRDQLATSQQPVLDELQSLHAGSVKHYSFINAVAATVSALEVARLESDPAVEAVVPDAKVVLDQTASAEATTAATEAADPVNATAGICGTAKKPLLAPEALKLMAATTPIAGDTGQGVKIAVFPDGLDPTITDYVRANGTKAIFDYRDFTGDGPKGVTGGGEAFGDASSIIAQGRQTFDLSKEVNPALPLPAHCDIRIKGVAPGASLAVMKVFGTNDSFDSTILQGLDWAVSHDHVNILSESFGGNPIPDPGTDPIAVFDADAVAHGITVVASSGDAGTTNTIGSPASSSAGIISAGATTAFQSNAELSEHGYQLAGDRGWIDNNISTFSSSGLTQYGPNTVDVVAPGDSGWADCSTDTTTFTECADNFGAGAAAPPIEDFGGTSQSCPLTAGVAALVIEAYEHTHGGVAPTPATVKGIITSTATDLGEPADEQGAGLVNATRAVELARSFVAPRLAPKPTGDTLAIGTEKIERTAAPGTTFEAKVKVTNAGSARHGVTPTVKRFGPATVVSDRTVTYDPASPSTPTFTYWLNGTAEPYAQQTFTVPAGYQRLSARIGYPADPTDGSQVVFEVLFDPDGRLVADSEPQGAPLGFSQVEARDPVPGTWRAIYFSRPGSDKYSGPIATLVTVQKLVTVAGAVTPAHATLAPGKSRTFTVTYTTPAAPGDASEALTFGAAAGEVPILTRAVAEPTPTRAAAFTGELTTGNGRAFFPGQELTYDFTVPAGVRDVDVDVHVGAPGYEVLGFLVNPQQQAVDIQDSTFVDLTTTDGSGANPTTADQTLHLSWQRPAAGLWTLELATEGGSSSGLTSTTVSGTIAFNSVAVTTAGLPDRASTVLAPDQATDATITVKNTGNSPEIYFVDPRLAGQSEYSLGWLTDPNGELPISPTASNAGVSQVLVPPASTSLTVVARAPQPVNFAMSPEFSSPEIESSTGQTAVATTSATDLAASAWSCAPTLVGPFATPTPGAPYSCAAFALTRTIDDTVSATGGNFWDTATDSNSANVFDPTVATIVPPGGSTTLNVAITPTDAEAGETLSGYLAVQTLDVNTFSSDDLVHLPYSYTVGAAPAA